MSCYCQDADPAFLDRTVFKHVQKTFMAIYAKVYATALKHKFAIMCVDVYEIQVRQIAVYQQRMQLHHMYLSQIKVSIIAK